MNRVRRKRRLVLAVSFVVAITGGLVWKLLLQPEVEFLGFREADGKRLAEFKINEPFYVRRYYCPLTIRSEGGAQLVYPVSSNFDPTIGISRPSDGSDPMFSIELPSSANGLCAFQVGLSYVNEPPYFFAIVPLRFFPQWVKKRKVGDLWSEMITIKSEAGQAAGTRVPLTLKHNGNPAIYCD